MDQYFVATLICLGVGILLLVIEMFTPGLGAAGAIGIISLFAAVMLQMGNTASMLFLIALVLFIIAVLLLIFFRLATSGKFDNSKIVLQEKIAEGSSQRSESGMQALIGATGVSLTPLRPAGKAAFADENFDVVTGGEFLPRGAKLEITGVEGLRIIVREKAAQEEGAAGGEEA